MRTNELIQSIGYTIADSISEDYSTAHLFMAIKPDAVQFIGEYITLNGEKKYYAVTRANPIIGREVLELHAIMNETGMSKWNKAIATLTPDGGFNIDFKWDQEHADEIEKFFT